MKNLQITNRTKINRMPKRASYDRENIYSILDSVFICHIGFEIEGRPYIIPTAFGRKDDHIFIHGSKNNRMLNSFDSGKDICFSVTICDGIVLARSAFHHSVNYRSVIMYGSPKPVPELDKKEEALEIIMEHIIPGRWKEIRKPDEKELNATSVYSLRIEEASAKVRTGPPMDDKNDMDLNIWAGYIPIRLTADDALQDPGSSYNIAIPEYIKNFQPRNLINI